MHQPNTTYRIQLNASFGFQQVEDHLPYYVSLGITDLYLSPILQAQPQSSHGYDAIGFEISTELGGEEQFIQLARQCKAAGLGLCVDIVPNHMAATEKNRYWLSVSKEGHASPFSYLFDVK